MKNISQKNIFEKNIKYIIKYIFSGSVYNTYSCGEGDVLHQSVICKHLQSVLGDWTIWLSRAFPTHKYRNGILCHCTEFLHSTGCYSCKRKKQQHFILIINKKNKKQLTQKCFWQMHRFRILLTFSKGSCVILCSWTNFPS